MREWMSSAAGYLFALLLMSGSVALGDDRARSVPLNPKPGVYRCGVYLYTLTELPRVGGKPVLVGSLTLENAHVAGGDYHRLELPVGSFIWYPPEEGQMEIGWTRIDPEKKQSRWSMALIAEKKNAQGHWVTRPRDPISEPKQTPKPPVPTGRGQ